MHRTRLPAARDGGAQVASVARTTIPSVQQANEAAQINDGQAAGRRWLGRTQGCDQYRELLSTAGPMGSAEEYDRPAAAVWRRRY